MSILKELRGITKRTIKYLSKDVYDVNSDKYLDEVIKDLKKGGGENTNNTNPGIITVGDSLGMYNVLTNDNATDERFLAYSEFASEFRHAISTVAYDFLNYLLYKNGITITFERTSELAADIYFNFGENENYSCYFSIETDAQTNESHLVVGAFESDVEGEDDKSVVMASLIGGILEASKTILSLIEIIDVES